MGPLDAIGHLLNLFYPAVALGLMATGLAKLLWRRELAAAPFKRLALPAMLACAAVTLAGLVFFRQDGKMATYASMVLACALALWWRGFGPGRR